MNNPQQNETLLTGLGMTAAATMIAQHIAGKATRDALFLTYFPVERLPAMMIASAVLSLVGVLLMSRLLARFGPSRLIPLLYLVSAGLLLVQWEFIGVAPQVSAAVLYLQIAAVNSLLISGFWSVINERFDPYSAKKVVARIAAASTFGGLAGGVLAKLVSSAADTHSILLMLAGMHVVCGLIVAVIGRGGTGVAGNAIKTGSLLSPLRESPLIRRLAVLALLVATTAAVLDYVLRAEAASALSDDQLITFFSYYYVGVGLAGFLLQSLVGNRALKWLGLGGAMAAWPLAIIGTGLMMLAVRTLMAATLLRASAALLYNSFFRAGFELLYTPVPARQKRTGKVLIDVGADRAGDMLGGFVVMGILFVPVYSESLLIVAAMVLAIVCGVLILRLQRDYSAQLADNLKSGVLNPDDIDVVDAPTSQTLGATRESIDRTSLLEEITRHRESRKATVPDSIRASPHAQAEAHVGDTQPTAATLSDPVAESILALRSEDENAVRKVLMSRDITATLLPHVVPLLKEAGVLQPALSALRRAAGHSPGQLVDALLDPMQSARVRRRIPIALAGSESPLAVQGLTIALTDRDDNVRFRAAQALDTIKRRGAATGFDEDAIHAAIDRELRMLSDSVHEGTRRADGLPRELETIFYLLGTLDDSETVALCWRAMHSDDRWLKGTALEYLESRLSAELWHELEPFLDAPPQRAAQGKAAGRSPRDSLHAAKQRLQGAIPGLRRGGDLEDTTGVGEPHTGS